MDPSAATPWQMWAVFAATLAAIGAFSQQRFAIEFVSAAVVAGLLVFFDLFPVAGPTGENLLGPHELLMGFANPALVSILALLVVGQGLFQTGAFDAPTQAMAASARTRPRLTIGLIFVAIGAVSAFMNNTPVVVMFLPILSALAATMNTPPSRLLMPLSFVCILAGMTTLIGSSTNLLVADAARMVDVDPIGFFDFTVPGLILAGVGALYVTFVLPHLLPDRQPIARTIANEAGKQFLVQIVLPAGHRLVGAEAVAGQFPGLKDMTVRVVERGDRRFLPPFDDLVLEAGDVVVLAGPRKAITALVTAEPELLSGMVSHQGATPEDLPSDPRAGGLIVTEAVVAPGSRLIGYSTELMRLSDVTTVAVIGIQRRSRMLRARLSEIRLEAGDVLLLLGTPAEIDSMRESRDLILLEWMAHELPNLHAAKRARVIFALVILTAATGLLPIVISGVLGAAAMIAFGCLNVRQAIRAADRQIYFLVGASLALGTALEATGGASFLARALVDSFAEFGPAVLASAFFLLVAVLTNILSNNATAVLFTPIAVSMASAMGVEPTVFLHAVIFAANCSFGTPIGYQTNLLVMGPGHYRFADFLRAGIPLILLIWLAFTFMAPWYYGL